jgi:NTE family protein
MAIVNSSSMYKKKTLLSKLFLIFALTACQFASKRSTSPTAPTETSPIYTRPLPPSGPPSTSREEPPVVNSQTLAVGVTPKIGLILGPGALRAYAHVGVVQEFAKQKLPIHSVVGMEMGALVAAIYANKGQPYDVEWQMMKLKESDLIQKNMLSQSVKAGDVKSLHEFINLSLSSARAENAKIGFACPALQMEKQQVLMMNRGGYADMLPYCLAFPPLFKPHQQNVAGILSLKAAVDYVRSKGATYVIYVDLLSASAKINGGDSETQIIWSLAADSLNRTEKGLDYVVHVPLKDFDLLDFNHRKEVIQRGQKAAQEAFSQIGRNLNL